MVSQADIATGLGLRISGTRAEMGMAKPRLGVTSDLMVMMPTTRPLRSSNGPPLLPGSMGMATWIMDRPSMLRLPDTTPATTLCLSPRIAQGNNGLAIDQPGRVAQRQRGHGAEGYLDDGQVVLAVAGMDRGHREGLAVGQLDRDGEALADDVLIGGDEAIGADDEAGADALADAVTAAAADDDDGERAPAGQLPRRRIRAARDSTGGAAACRDGTRQERSSKVGRKPRHG